MGNSSSRKARRPKPRNSLSKIFKATPTGLSPKLNQCSETNELGIWATAALSDRAYRHHRKRLARIVADQWMYAARFRLITLKFRKKREQNLQRSCIAEWRNVVEHRFRKSQILERASVLCRFLVERRSFNNWKNFFHSKRILAEAFERTSHMVRCKQQTMFLTALQTHWQAKIMERQQCMKAQNFRILNVLKTSLSQWSTFVQERDSTVLINMRVYDKWANNRLRLVIIGWKEVLLLDKAQQVSCDTAKDLLVTQAQVIEINQVGSVAPEDPVIQAEILTKYFWRWYLLVSQKNVKREKCGDKSLVLAERHCERKLQRAAYDGWRKSASQSSSARSISQQSLESESMIKVRPQWKILPCSKPARQVWGTGPDENPKVLSDQLKQKYCSTSSRKEWTIGQNDYAIAKIELLKQMSCSTGSRRVWTTGENDYAKTKSEILKLMYCSKPSSREVAVSWFVKSLVKRFLCLWKDQVLIIKRHRQNNWYAVVHSKMQCLLKGFHALLENVDVENSKQSLQDLSMNCYHQNLKRKTVSGCKLLHQTKRAKVVQIEQALAMWTTARLQERFDKWYFAIALRSMRRSLQQKSVNFRNRQLLLRAFQSWRDIKGSFREKGNLKMVRLTRLRGSLGKLKKSRILSSWKSLRKEINIKRFNQALALQFFFGFRAAPVFKALYVHMQERKLKRSLHEKAAHFENTRSSKLVLSTWCDYVLLRNLSRLAANHRRHRQLKHAMTSLIQWQRPHVEFRDMEEDSRLPDIAGIYRKFNGWEPPASSQKPPVTPARAQPRRPAFLYEDGMQPQAKHSHRHKSSDNKRSPGPLTPRDPNLVAKEIEWMEQILLDYEELKVGIVELRAELALLLEERAPGLDDSFDQQDRKIHAPQDQKILLFQQEIESLEAKRKVQRPLIHAVLSRVKDLRITNTTDS